MDVYPPTNDGAHICRFGRCGIPLVDDHGHLDLLLVEE